MSDAEIFSIYSHYYDLLYREKDYAGDVKYIDDILTRYNVTGRELLEFGSGTGKHGRLLVERGYKVVGVERSAEMVARASVFDGFDCRQGDICEVKLGRTFDAVLSLFHVISYQVANADLHAAFFSAAQHLCQGGLFVFDVWYSPAVYTQRPVVRVKRLADATHEITRIAEPVFIPNENRVDVHYTILAQNIATGCCETLTENHPMRHFSLPEIDTLANAAGFERVCAEEFLTGAEPGEDTWGVCVVLRKN